MTPYYACAAAAKVLVSPTSKYLGPRGVMHIDMFEKNLWPKNVINNQTAANMLANYAKNLDDWELEHIYFTRDLHSPNK